MPVVSSGSGPRVSRKGLRASRPLPPSTSGTVGVRTGDRGVGDSPPPTSSLPVSLRTCPVVGLTRRLTPDS